MANARTEPRVEGRGASAESRGTGFSALAGVVFGLVLIKLGTPVIFDAQIQSPGDLLEILLMSWPVSWGYALLAVLAVAGLLHVFKSAIRNPQSAIGVPAILLFCLPLIWFGWQCLAATQTVEPRLTRLALPHFAACVLCFLAGRFVLARVGNPCPFWYGLLAAFAITLMAGLDQHFGGLAETRRQFEQLPPEVLARMDSPELRARMGSDRIFSTFVYSNAFAGAILLLLPAGIYGCWHWGSRHGRAAGLVLAAIPAVVGAACLYWSGSKAGWLIALAVLLVAVWFSSLPRRFKLLLLGGVLAVGMAGFFVKYSGYFAKGATSAGARLDYWRAAATVAKQHPVLGTGPGTFSVLYKRLKPPEAEMARLAHNDYLQQACDSGAVGFLAYAVFVAGTLVQAARNRALNGWRLAAWLGALGFALQGLVEFGLYIPGLAWPAFFFLGWLQAAD